MDASSTYIEHVQRATGAFMAYLDAVPTCARKGDQDQADRLGEIVQTEARAAREARTAE